MAEYLWIFWSFSLLGWVLERLFAAVTRSPRQRRRCLLLLPLCPVYGLGMAAVLAGMPSRAGEVLDVVVPVPSWQFTNSAVQPLHSWSIPEYRLRMEERLSRYLAPEEREAVDRAWS